MSNLDIKEIRKDFNKNQKEFAKMLGVGVRAVQSWESGERNISQSVELLLNMIISNNTQNSDATPLNLSEMNIMRVPLVSKFAYAGYLDNMGDDEYEDDLPKIAFTSDRENKGDYLAFEVKGDSMDNGLSNCILEGDILLARNVRQDYWTSKLHINKWNFIIVHKERGILIKRITEHNTATHEITLHSLNDYYEDITVHLKDIQAIYNVVDIKRKPIL